MILILLLISQTLSLRVLPCIDCLDNPKYIRTFPSLEENELTIKTEEFKRFAQTNKKGKWDSQNSKLPIYFKSGIFSITFKKEDDKTTMVLELQANIPQSRKIRLKFILAPFQVKFANSANFEMEAFLSEDSQYLLTETKDLACPVLISVDWLGTSNQVSEISLNSEKCELSLQLFPSEEPLEVSS